jgi:hypothetical protein
MMDRQSVYFVVGLAILCGMAVYGMFHYARNIAGVELPPVSKVSSSAADGKSQTLKEQPSATESEIRNVEERQTPPSATDSRNPFLWNGELEPKVVVKVEEKPITPPRLGMIVVGPEARLAFLDEKLVYEGRQYGGFRVEKIAPRVVTLSSADGRFQLIAPEGRFGPAEVKREERKHVEKR